MLNEKDSIRISKFLSLVLRHKPEQIGLSLDENGWADVDDLIEKCKKANVPLTPEVLQYIVETNPKKRFAFNEMQNKIRANQGHSIAVELALEPVEPPVILYHGTATRFVASIWEKGLIKQQRQHVHLSADSETAVHVGQRHGQVFIFEVSSKQMFEDGYLFFLSKNGVWLTDYVPVKYLCEMRADG